jgi:hypothetical protein
MIFDIVCIFVIVGLFLRGIKNATKGKIPLVIALVASVLISSSLIPIYMKFLSLPKDIPAGIVSFIITFAFVYIIISVPALIISVVVLGSLMILVLGIIVTFIPSGVKATILENSKIFPVILPLIDKIKGLFPKF